MSAWHRQSSLSIYVRGGPWPIGHSSPAILNRLHRFESDKVELGDALVTRLGDRVNTPGWTSSLSPAENIALATVQYAERYAQFLKSYKPLLDEGVLRIHSLADSFSGSADGGKANSELELITLAASLVQGDILLQPTFQDVLAELLTDSVSDADHAYSVGLLWRAAATSFGDDSEIANPDFLSTLIEVVELFTAVAISQSGTFVTFYEKHPTAVTMLAQHVNTTFGTAPQSKQSPRLQLDIMATVLASFPAINARSADALLDLRRQLQPELAELRDKIDDIATDLSAAGEGSDAVSLEVERRIQRPVRDLTRRLARPSRDVARNLFSNQSFLTAAITLAATYVTTAPLSAATLSLAVPLLGSSLQTLLDRKRQVDQSVSHS